MDELKYQKMLDEIQPKRKTEREIGTQIAETIHQYDGGKELFSWHIYQAIGKRLGELKPEFYDFSFMEQLYEGYLEAAQKDLLNDLNTIWNLQAEKVDSYGDADFFVTKLVETPDLRVFTLKDICTCADESYFIVIQDLKKEEVHIRVLWEKGDYPKARYPKKQNLRFWKDRGYQCDFVEAFHMTNKGGVYGDARDTGYVMSFRYGWPKDIVNGSVFYYSIRRRVQFTIGSIADQLRDDHSSN